MLANPTASSEVPTWGTVRTNREQARYLTLNEVLELYRQVIAQSSGAVGVLSREALESALAQPQMTFGGENLYPTLVEKAAALGYALKYNGCMRRPMIRREKDDCPIY